MSVVLPVIMFTLLGDTFNLRKYDKTGFSIYDENYNKTVNIPTSSTGSYLVIKSSTDVPRFLGVEPRLSLDIKLTWNHNHWGLSSFITESSWRSLDKFVQILIKIEHIVTKETSPPNAEINDRWKERDPAHFGTHYVHSLIKGGHLVTSIVFRVNTDQQKDAIEKAVQKHLGRSGNLTDDFKDRLNKINQELGENIPHYSIESINCASCNRFINSIDQIIDFSKGFPNDYANNPVPVLMELDDLSNLISNYPSYFENSEVISVLEDLNEKLDDLETAEYELREWGKDPKIYTLPESQQDMIYSLGEKVEEVKGKLADAYYNLDFGQNSSVRQFDDFYDAYGTRDADDVYTNRLKELQKFVLTLL